MERICPIAKVKMSTLARDFRPTSILSILSKVLERTVLQQMSKSIKNNIFYIIDTNHVTGNTTKH